MNQIIRNMSLFVDCLIKKQDFSYVVGFASGVQYSNTGEECCEEKDGCCGNCNCE